MWLASLKEPTNARTTFHVQEAARYAFLEEVCTENNLVSPSRFLKMQKKLNARNSDHFRVAVFTDLEHYANEMGYPVVAKMDSGWDAAKSRAMAEIQKRRSADPLGFRLEDHTHVPGCAELLFSHESAARNNVEEYSKEVFYVAANRKTRGRSAAATKVIKQGRDGRPPRALENGAIKEVVAWEYNLRKMNSRMNRIAGIVLKLPEDKTASDVRSELRGMFAANGSGNGAKPHKSVIEQHKVKYPREGSVRAVKYHVGEPHCAFLSYETAGFFIVEFKV